MVKTSQRIRQTVRAALFGVTLLTLGLAAGCVKGSNATTTPNSTSTDGSGSESHLTPSGEPSTHSTAVAGSGKGDYLGCHEFCMQAGPIGGGGPGFAFPDAGKVGVLFDRITIADGMVPITILCTRDDACEGWIIVNVVISGSAAELGRSDLSVPGHSVRVIAVKASSDGQAQLNELRQLPADIVIEYDDPACPAEQDGRHECFVLPSVTISAQ